MKSVLLLTFVVLNLVWLPASFAADNTCWLTAGSQDDVWVIVYDADEEGDRGGVLFEGKIPAGGKIKVNSTDGHIRYKYKMNPNEGYVGDISTDCYQQESILLD